MCLFAKSVFWKNLFLHGEIKHGYLEDPRRETSQPCSRTRTVECLAETNPGAFMVVHAFAEASPGPALQSNGWRIRANSRDFGETVKLWSPDFRFRDFRLGHLRPFFLDGQKERLRY